MFSIALVPVWRRLCIRMLLFFQDSTVTRFNHPCKPSRLMGWMNESFKLDWSIINEILISRFIANCFGATNFIDASYEGRLLKTLRLNIFSALYFNAVLSSSLYVWYVKISRLDLQNLFFLQCLEDRSNIDKRKTLSYTSRRDPIGE